MKFLKLLALVLLLALPAKGSVRFDGNTEYLGRTANLINYNAAYTVMFWAYITTDGLFFGHYWGATASNTETTGDYQNSDFAGFGSDGHTFRGGSYVSGSDDVGNGPAFTPATWYHITIRRNSSSDIEFLIDGVVEVTSNTQDVSGRSAVGGEWLGRLNQDFYLNGRVAYYKAWTVALTDLEIADEMLYENAKKSANLHSVARLESDLVEEINGYDWTGNGSYSFEADPPGLTEFSGGGGGGGTSRTCTGAGH